MGFAEYMLGTFGMGVLMLFGMLISYNSEHPVISIIIAFVACSAIMAILYLCFSVLFLGGAL